MNMGTTGRLAFLAERAHSESAHQGQERVSARLGFGRVRMLRVVDPTCLPLLGGRVQTSDV